MARPPWVLDVPRHLDFDPAAVIGPGVAPPGVDHFTPLPPRRERHFVGLGHVWERKGVLEALELVAKLPGEWHFDWLGALDVDTAYTARVLRRRAELKLETRVTFHGRTTRAQVADFLSRSSACLATARFFLYLNVRTRTEGWDIQTRFAQLAMREGAE